MTGQSCDAFEYRIFMAGDIAIAKQVCREFCYKHGFCVTVTPTSYIYTGGEEEGFIVSAINYPRFPTTKANVGCKMLSLAELLVERCCQHSYTIQSPTKAVWFSRRQET